MKNKIIYILFIIFFSCKQNINDINDEKNYILFKSDSFNHVIASKVLVNKYDPTLHLVKFYFADGNIFSKSFFRKAIHEGTKEIYSDDGRVMISEYYKNGVKDGLQKEYYSNTKLERAENYMNGKLISVEYYDSSGNKIKK